nr:uncharacterized protein CFP56_76496 [Quercus suber]
MPPPSSRMTKNRAQPLPWQTRVEEPDEDSDEDEDEDDILPASKRGAPPKASSFPTQRRTAGIVLEPGKPIVTSHKEVEQDLSGFVTESESSEDGSEDGSESGDETGDESEEEEDESEDEPEKTMLRPTFISKAKRAQTGAVVSNEVATQQAGEDERRRKEKADEMLKAQLERDAAVRAAGRKAWDDDDVAPEDEIDDTDDLDPEAEKASWKLRELKRVRRERLLIEEKEKELEEVERRRNMTAEEREAEDKVYIEAQQKEREGKGKMGYMQKYHHKGAFFQNDDEMDEEVKAAMNRDFAGAKFADDVGDKSVLPEYMRIRDMTKLGKKGRTKYKDLRNEDTGRWGEVGQKRRYEDDGLDDRFKPDDARNGGSGTTGANSAPVGERRKMHSHEKRARYD